MKTLIFLLALTALCSTGSDVRAQPELYRFKHLDVNTGLTYNEVISFVKDRKGFLWIGTTAGLNRFDGYAIKPYLNDVRDSTSISDNYINTIAETPDGQLAIFTPSGVNLYDPATETFTTNLQRFYTRYGLRAGMINDIVKDRIGNYWFMYDSLGMIRHDPAHNQTVVYSHRPGDSTGIATDSISALTQDAKGNTWIIHTNGVFEKISGDGSSPQVLYRNTSIQNEHKNVRMDYRLFADTDGDLWIYAANQVQGVYFFDVRKQTFTHLHQDAKVMRLNTNIVRSIVEDGDGLLWIATDHGGVNIVDKRKQMVQYILHKDEDEKSIGQNSINTLYKDDEGIIWIGTFKKGLSYYHENIIRFPLYKPFPMNAQSLPFGDVNRFVEDEQGNLWIGTNGGGLIYFDRKKQTFRQFVNDPADPGSLSSNVIVSLCIDHEKKLWIGTYYGGLNCYDGRNFKRYIQEPGRPGSLSDRSVWEIFEDSRGRLWVGTLNGGLNLLDRTTGTFTHYRAGDLNSIQGNYISAISEDREGNLWFGTATGLDVLVRQTGRFIHYETVKGDDHSISSNNIFDIREDSQGRIWIGTSGGLNLFDKTTRQFSSLTVEDGLPHNSVLTVLEDNTGNLWLGTPNGLSNLTITRQDGKTAYRFKNFDEADGLQGKQFNENAAFKTSRGELIFGGSNGFNLFMPGQLGLNSRPPTVVLSDFQIFQHSAKPGENIDGRVILKNSITQTDHITLPYNKNFFSVEFAALNYFHPEKNRYTYKLEGLHSEWLKADSKSRKVTFTNLDPGEYIFKVNAANNDGVWSAEPTQLSITILPPFWKTRYAFVGYVLLVVLALIGTRKLIQQRERMKYAIAQERQEAIRMHELDMMKIKFFTNVSHEFRTPLTLILTPIERILRQTKDINDQQQFRLIHRNAKRLLNLVNQLLDFRKMEVQELKLNPSEGDIIQFIRETVYSFSDLSEKKNIKFEFTSGISALETLFDKDKLEKILFNLLSNAFKFTREGGEVSVTVTFFDDPSQKVLRIAVKDNGIGIEPDKQERIFDRFFQNELPKSIMNQGSGIGLSITREFVRIHNGNISVESDAGEGSTFTVNLPITEVLHHVADPATEPIVSPVSDQAIETEWDTAVTRKPLLLLVEDNEDFRFYLKDNLKFEFTILEARDGHDGWRQTVRHLPDLIVSDVMMPEMNGIELCRKIKSEERVSHIPVILLTARTEEEQKLEGIQTGA
ncbi:MAG TPA: two-component regulator propeller domain-containing protein, partial [Ohtaekwangia sp.]|nr:two-component regulator propeller domain-containing protein [Ohtaekwangia sp.]